AGIVVLGGDLLRLLTDARFHAAATTIPWIASGVFFYGCYHLANTGLFLGRSLKITAWVWVLMGSLSLTANTLLIPHYGMMAAAQVQCGTFLTLTLVILALSQKRHRIKIPGARLLSAVAMVG